MDLESQFPDDFATPVKSLAPASADKSDALKDEKLFPFSQKLSLTPLHDEEVSVSASELLSSELSDRKSELTEKNKLLRRAQEEVREYKLKCDALLSTLAESKKRQRDEPRTPGSATTPPSVDEAPKKKPSPPPPAKAETPSKEPPAAQLSGDEVPPPAPQPVPPNPPKVCKEYERLQSILCAYKAKTVVPGSSGLPFDICALMCKEEADLVKGWSASTCAMYHKALISALKLVYPNKMEAWYDKPFLRSPLGTAKYWARVVTRRAEIWQIAADKAAAAFATPPESQKQRIRRRIAERKAQRLSTLQVACSRSPPRNVLPPPLPARKARSGLSSDSDEASAAVIDLSQSPPASSSSSASVPSSASSSSASTPSKTAPSPS